MSEAVVRVACLQLKPAVGDTAGNVERALRAIDEAAAQGAELIVLPELATTGYAFRDAQEAKSCAEPLDGPSVSSLKKASAGGPAIVAGVCELGDGGEVYNTAVLLEGGELRARYRKLHLWGREQSLFTPGEEEPPVVETSLGRVGLAVCYDLEFPELPRSLALRGAELIALPTNWPYVDTPEGERPMLHTLAMATARLSRVWLALCDRGGAERGNRYLGASIIVGPDGWPLDASEPGRPVELLMGECDLSLARDKRIGESNDVFGDRRAAFYSTA